jgi:hypothetical protein
MSHPEVEPTRTIRCRITPSSDKHERKVLRRKIKNVTARAGQAKWLLEDIYLEFDMVGYVKYPGLYDLCMVVREVTDRGPRQDWILVDGNSIEWKGKPT